MSNLPKHYEKAKPSYRPAQTSEPGFTLNKLNPDDFHEICGLSELVRKVIPDSDKAPYPGCLFQVGYAVETPDGSTGRITGYAVDTETEHITYFARVNGRLYHVSVLKRA